MQCPVALTVITVTFCGFPKQEFEAVGNDVRGLKKQQVYFTLRQRCTSSSRVLTEDLSEDLGGTGAGLYQ